MDVIPIQVSGGSLQQPPVPALVVRDVCLDLVVLPLVSDQHAFDSRHLVGTTTITSNVSVLIFLNAHQQPNEYIPKSPVSVNVLI